MHKIIHGGDIYRNQVQMDFSVNTNPLGIPEGVKEALADAVENCRCYPDIHAAELVHAISGQTGVEPDMVVCGNGASELFMAIVHAEKPKKILIPVPSFYGYERSAQASGAQTVYYEMREDDCFSLTGAFLEQLTDDIDLLFLATPNNPVGNLTDRNLLKQICQVCGEKQITVILDECFIEFTQERGFAEENSLREFPHVIVVRAFTKIYAIPGVRLGYLLCGGSRRTEKIREQLPEWNLSCFAQEAGIAALRENEYRRQSVRYVAEERAYLTRGLQSLGVRVWPAAADFLLIQSRSGLYEKLLEQGILIRDCSNFRGLAKGCYRIAVRTHEENQRLMEMVGKIIETD
ncbi:pyridoxal phosphate-dependent aminotransferase [Hespellia stercorisuis]|uniref:Histidinol-phosphate aminotransferase n=1 Tax=Hespellia stercorisuis DSM 15480 TaxID=1121950 RepID=A0A1M6KIX5_9FIRM|nr:histidinol-phosphate transaminase [Hespellia stercorisuis]SHJ58904.1 histidinol-phosphate aminotransferase [Hespellia stercorisuis DSM 15480]